MNDFSSTIRAYTLRLKGTNEGDRSWIEKLWQTHEIVNRGTKVWGDWLLTLRGGLSHELAGLQEETGRDRRILLALSWLSVESRDGAPKEYIIEIEKDKKTIVNALRDILKNRGVEDEETENWVVDCGASLSAAIRDDAVWVNRGRAFDEAREEIGEPLSRDEVWDVLGKFFGGKEGYFKPVDVSKGGSKAEGVKRHVIAAGNWLSKRFGGGKGSDYEKLAEACSKMAGWAADAGRAGKGTIANLAAELGISDSASQNLAGILPLLRASGRKSKAQGNLEECLGEIAEESGEGTISEDRLNDLRGRAKEWETDCKEKRGRKGRKPWTDKILDSIENSLGSKFTYSQEQGPAKHWQFAVMLDHAARRLSAAHTWIKRAEAERRNFEENSRRMAGVPRKAREWLENYCRERSEASGAVEGYRIRPRAVGGWEDIIGAWEGCKNEEERIAAARAKQGEIDKFGDIQLFRDLAADDAISVWRINGKPNGKALSNYVDAVEAEFNRKRFKVPAYRHPDPLLHPVFCDYGESRWAISFEAHKPRKPKKEVGAVDVHSLKMEVWNGEEIEKVRLCWQSKLLEKDLDIKQGDEKKKGVPVSRASRMGRAAAGFNWETPVSIRSVFDEKHWNGRLQVSRDELDWIAGRVKRNKGNEEAIFRRIPLKWFVTLSPKLKPQGPWLDYVRKSEDKTPFKIEENDKGKYKVGLHLKNNENREGSARLILSRLPGLRVLSIDLGLRHAAACAVWETLSSEQMKDACEKEGCSETVSDAMYLHIKSDKHKCTVYRRIGSDRFPDGSPHPAPWARLGRQFLIKLQGEERPARRPTAGEIGRVEELRKMLGSDRPPTDKLVDKLMYSAVRTIRGALRRHSDRARIAYYLISRKKIESGGRAVKLDHEGRKESIADALLLWYELAMGRKWRDPQALELWEEHIKPSLPDGELPDIAGGGISFKEIKKRKKELEEKLIPVAERLFGLSALLSAKWQKRWKEDDEKLRKQLRWLRDWILPRGAKKKEKSIRNVGGLSLDRLGTVEFLYQAHKAYYTRFTPNGLKDGKPITAGESFGRRILDDREDMREQRVKQLSSRIVEAALGIGRMSRKGGDSRRPIERVDKPCHAVVIENLTNYRPRETRSRRENRQLMAWSAAKVKKYLLEDCTLHGLLLREVSSQHTSRQDSRTGAPGLRCEDVTVKKFHESSFWQKEVSRAEKAEKKKKTGAYEKYLLRLKRRWEDSGDNAALLRIPNKGGEIFTSANGDSPASRGLQADLNAAANIGLKALIDPDWPGSWWYVPCGSGNFEPIAERVKGSLVFENAEALTADSVDGKKSKAAGRKKGKKTIVNLWRDPSCKFSKTGWKYYAGYWDDAEARVIDLIKRLRQQVVW